MPTVTRRELGDYSSIVCLKSIITGMEGIMGDKATATALIAAGRIRGKKLAEDLELAGLSSLDEAAQRIRQALG
jgi:hypothetical protein